MVDVCFPMFNTNLSTSVSGFAQSRSQSQMSAFDESVLNVSQFVQLTETFMGHHPNELTFERLVAFLKDGYEETEEEKMERLLKVIHVFLNILMINTN